MIRRIFIGLLIFGTVVYVSTKLLTLHSENRACAKHDFRPHPYQHGAIDGTARRTHLKRCLRCLRPMLTFAEHSERRFERQKRESLYYHEQGGG